MYSCSKIQLSSPNWLYGLTKEEEEEEREEFAQKVDSDANTNGAAQDDSMSNGSCDFNWLSQEVDCNEEDIFQRFESDTFCAQDIMIISVRLWNIYYFLLGNCKAASSFLMEPNIHI